jgi:hypothetical protein
MPGVAPGSVTDTVIGMNSDEWARWWVDVGGQVVAGVVVLVLAACAAAVTPWGKRIRDRIAAALRTAVRFVRSLRLTTRPRIEGEIEAAVEAAVREATEPDPDDDDGEGRPLRPDEYRGWVMERAPEPRTWLLRNQTGQVGTVEALILGVNSNFEWEYPELPVTLADGDSFSFPARRIRTSTSFLPFMDRPMANVVWEDDHGDQHEDIVWIVIDR